MAIATPNLEYLNAVKVALKECADDLETEVNSRYMDSMGKIHPALIGKYHRDMAPVLNARKLLEQ